MGLENATFLIRNEHDVALPSNFTGLPILQYEAAAPEFPAAIAAVIAEHLHSGPLARFTSSSHGLKSGREQGAGNLNSVRSQIRERIKLSAGFSPESIVSRPETLAQTLVAIPGEKASGCFRSHGTLRLFQSDFLSKILPGRIITRNYATL
jgi:hypothetical protein